MIIVFGLACSVVTATEQMRIGWLRGCRSRVFLIVEVPYKINAKCDHLVAFFKVVSNAEMRAASTTAKNEIEIVSQDDENNSGKFFEPLHLLNSAKKNSEEITQQIVCIDWFGTAQTTPD